jgi:hypothetical protein
MPSRQGTNPLGCRARRAPPSPGGCSSRLPARVTRRVRGVSLCATSTTAARVARDTIPLVVLRAGTHRVGAGNGTLQVRTYREGLAQKVGHDLIIDVGQWEAAAEVRQDGTLSAVQLNADPHSLRVREGLHGVKPLTDKDRADIRKTINEKILGGRPIAFRSTAVEAGDGVSPCAANSSSRVRGGRRASSSTRRRTAG